MIDSHRRTVLASGAAAAAASAVPQVFAQAQPAGPAPGLPDGAKVGFYEKGDVRIRYAEIGSGFPLLATPGGGLNSCMAVWARAVINIPEAFKNDFRVITMDQRNATGGESTGPVDSPPVALRWSMVMMRKSFLNSSGMLITARAHTAMQEFRPPPGVARSGKPEPISV